MIRHFRNIVLITIATIPMLMNHAQGRTIYVSQTGDGSDGSSWGKAIQSIGNALVRSTTGDILLVSAETYQEDIVIATPMTMIGGLLPNESNDGLINQEPRHTVISAFSEGWVIEVTSDTVIQHFLIQGAYGLGATGMRIHDADVELSHCMFQANSGNVGCGIRAFDARVNIRNCVFQSNVAISNGAGISATNVYLTIEKSIFRNNRCLGIPGDSDHGVPRQPGFGGGLYLSNSHADIVNCLFFGNYAELGSDISYGAQGSLRCENCSFGSTAYPNIRKGSSLASGPTQFSNSIIWGHDNPFQGPDWIVTNSTVRGGFPGEGNIDADPLFVDPANGDFHLQAGSPCIDSASTTGPATDLDGNARPYDVPDVGRNGTGDEFDMGAYEFIPTPAPTFLNDRSDIDGSTKVDSKDLLILLADWKKVTDAVTKSDAGKRE